MHALPPEGPPLGHPTWRSPIRCEYRYSTDRMEQRGDSKVRDFEDGGDPVVGAKH